MFLLLDYKEMFYRYNNIKKKILKSLRTGDKIRNEKFNGVCELIFDVFLETLLKQITWHFLVLMSFCFN